MGETSDSTGPPKAMQVDLNQVAGSVLLRETPDHD
jgi:hypothetical protein